MMFEFHKPVNCPAGQHPRSGAVTLLFHLLLRAAPSQQFNPLPEGQKAKEKDAKHHGVRSTPDSFGAPPPFTPSGQSYLGSLGGIIFMVFNRNTVPFGHLFQSFVRTASGETPNGLIM